VPYTLTQFGTTSNTALSLFYTHSSSPLHTHWSSQSSLVVSWQTDVIQFHCHFNSHVKSSCHSLISSQSLRLPSPELDQILIRLQFYTPSIASFGTLLSHNSSARTPRKTLSSVRNACLLARYVAMDVLCVRVYCGNVFTDPSPSNGYTRYGTIPEFTCRHWEVPRGPSVCVLPKILTSLLPNKSQNISRWANLNTALTLLTG
jgi:hypothetical protein